MKVNYATIIADTISVSGKSRHVWLFSILVSSIVFNIIFLIISLFIYFNEFFLSRIQLSKLSSYQEAFLNFLNSMDQLSLVATIIFIQGIVILTIFFMTTTIISLFYGVSALYFSIRSAYGNSYNSIYESSFFSRERWLELFKIFFFGIFLVLVLGVFLIILFSNFYNNPLVSAGIIITAGLVVFTFLMMSIYWFYYILFHNMNWQETFNESFRAMFENFIDNFLYLLLGGILKSFLFVFSLVFFTYLILSPLIMLTLDFWRNIQIIEVNMIDVLVFSSLVYLLLNFSSITTSVCVYFMSTLNLIFNEEIESSSKSGGSY